MPVASLCDGCMMLWRKWDSENRSPYDEYGNIQNHESEIQGRQSSVEARGRHKRGRLLCWINDFLSLGTFLHSRHCFLISFCLILRCNRLRLSGDALTIRLLQASRTLKPPRRIRSEDDRMHTEVDSFGSQALTSRYARSLRTSTGSTSL